MKFPVLRNIITWSIIGIYGIVTIFAMSDGFTKIFMVILVFVPILISIFIGKYCVKSFKTKKRTRKQNIAIFLIIILFTTIFILGGDMAILFSTMKFGKSDDMPKNTVVLELSDFGTNTIPERTRIREKSSIFVPVSFEYYESLGRKAKEEENQISKVSEELWNIDRGYYLHESKSEIIIQKDNIIYILDGDIDFSEEEIVDICEGKLGL